MCLGPTPTRRVHMAAQNGGRPIGGSGEEDEDDLDDFFRDFVQPPKKSASKRSKQTERRVVAFVQRHSHHVMSTPRMAISAQCTV